MTLDLDQFKTWAVIDVKEANQKRKRKRNSEVQKALARLEALARFNHYRAKLVLMNCALYLG